MDILLLVDYSSCPREKQPDIGVRSIDEDLDGVESSLEKSSNGIEFVVEKDSGSNQLSAIGDSVSPHRCGDL